MYGQPIPTLTVSYAGFKNGDSAASLAARPSLSTTATTTSPVGIYAITAAGAIDPNYAITYVPGKLTVNKDATTTASAERLEGAFGQTFTLSATVTANAPGSGSPSGDVDFFDSITGVELASVTLKNGEASLSTAALAPGLHSIKFTYSGDSNFLASGATTRTITIDPSIIVLDPSARGALSISGNASIAIAGAVDIDSGSSGALTAAGNTRISASTIAVHGGVSKSTTTILNPQPQTGAPPVPDPLKELPEPSTSGMTNFGRLIVGGYSTQTINPGIYSQISISGNASVTLRPGIYIVEGGGFAVSNNASVTGTGVTIYNVGSKFPFPGVTYAPITLESTGAIKLSPATTGPYAGLLFIQPADNSQTLTFAGNAAAGVRGMVYAPSAHLLESGSIAISTALVVDTVTLVGNAPFGISTASSALAFFGVVPFADQSVESRTNLVSGAVLETIPQADPRHDAAPDWILDDLVFSLFAPPKRLATVRPNFPAGPMFRSGHRISSVLQKSAPVGWLYHGIASNRPGSGYLL